MEIGVVNCTLCLSVVCLIENIEYINLLLMLWKFVCGMLAREKHYLYLESSSF